jgi:hypothetical protein
MCGFYIQSGLLCTIEQPALCERICESGIFASPVSRRLSKREIIISRGCFLHAQMQIKDNGIYRWENNFHPLLETSQHHNMFFAAILKKICAKTNIKIAWSKIHFFINHQERQIIFFYCMRQTGLSFVNLPVNKQFFFTFTKRTYYSKSSLLCLK